MWLEHTTVSGIRCDKRDCRNTYHCEPTRYFDVYRTLPAEAEQVGWTFYAGRSARQYCPYHGPSPTAKLRRISYQEVSRG